MCRSDVPARTLEEDRCVTLEPQTWEPFLEIWNVTFHTTGQMILICQRFNKTTETNETEINTLDKIKDI